MILAFVAFCWITGVTVDRPALASELTLLDLAPGDEYIVVGWYQSRMGDRLSLDGCPIEFELPRNEQYPALRAFDLRASSLSLCCRVEHGGEPGSVTHRALGVIEGPSTDRLLESVRDTFATTPHRRRLAVIDWAFSLDPDKTPEAISTASGFMEQTLRDLSAVSPDQRRIELILQLFSNHRAVLYNTPLWKCQIERMANEFVTSPAAENLVRELGFVHSGDGWISETQFLSGLRMVRHGDAIVTEKRATLESVVDEWEVSGKRKSLLRGLTNSQYETYVRRRELHVGMRRTEALNAWGYPGEVTWLSRGEHRFEVWWFRDRQAYLVDDLIFKWNEE